MGFLTPILTPIVNSLLVPIKRHLGFLVSSSKKVRYMHAELKKLESAAVDMRTRQESNDENRLAVPDRVPSWLAEVGTIKEQAQTIPTGEVRCCFNMKARYNAGKRSSDILEDIDRLMNEQRSDIKWTNEPKPLGKVSFKKVSTSTVVHEDDTQSRDISSRDPILNDALKSLESNDNKTQMMALTGMGGVGKTTMMEQLKKAAEGRKMFNYIVKVVIGKDRAVVDIQTTIATYIRANLSNADKDTRADELQKKFENISKEGENKILVIFDDVWEKVNFKLCGLSNPLPKGFKLLFTSRDENVCAQMGVDSSLIFKIGVLKDEEAKRLFWKTAQPSSNNDITQDDIRKIGDGIIKVCGGLPLAIAIIASALRDKEKVEWEDAFTRLQKKTLDDYDIKATFEISYKNLKEDDLKAIFILSGLFPEDDYIIIEDLLMYGWGLKFFQNVHTIAEARTRVNTCIKKLMRSNLLIKSDREGCVKMHDLVREYVLSNFSEVKQASIANYNNDSELLKDEESYERILLKCVGMSEFPVDFNHTNLTLLKLIGKSMPLKFPGQFYLRMKSLKVVAFEHMLQPLLPRSLTNLRSLCLISCFLAEDDISFLGDLTNLEVLKLANCHIHMLPSKIGNLKRLKLLDLTGCGGLSIDDGVFENLKKLEELYMRGSPWSTIRFTDVNCRELKMLKLSALEIEFFENRPQPNDVSFEKMKRFRIAMGCQFRNREIDKYSFKNTLNLKTSKTELQNCNILELFKETEILRLEVNDMSYLEEIVFQDSFRNLKALTILNCESLACVFTNSVAKGLLTLERLVIGWCPVLKELWPCEITSSEEEVNNISMLKKIEVWKCKSLVNLFPCNPMRLLSNLKRLEVEECDSIEVLFNIDFGKIEQLRSNSSLRDIEVRDCVRFREVWRIKDAGNNNFNIGSFQAAENISIRKCERFRSILSPTTASYDMRTVKNINIHKRPLQINPILDDQGIPKVGDNNMSVVAFISSSRNFHELKEIELLCVHDVEVMFEIESSNNGVQLPSLEHLKLNSINNLKHVWKCNNWNEWFILQKHQPHSSFQNLTNIRLSDCPSIKYLFPPLIMKLLSNLKEVKLDLCDSMEEIVYSNRENEDEEMMTTTSFPHLDQLNLYKMNNLKHIGGGVAANDTTNYVIHGQSKLDVVHWSLCLFSRQIWIAECNLLMEVFETKDINNININTTFGIPRTTNSIMHKLNNLKTLVIRDCACLEYVFTFSTLESLEKLETLVIRGCKVMKVIVREEYHEVQMLRASSKNMGVI